MQTPTRYMEGNGHDRNRKTEGREEFNKSPVWCKMNIEVTKPGS